MDNFHYLTSCRQALIEQHQAVLYAQQQKHAKLSEQRAEKEAMEAEQRERDLKAQAELQELLRIQHDKEQVGCALSDLLIEL